MTQENPMHISLVMCQLEMGKGQGVGDVRKNFISVIVAGVENLTLYGKVDHWWQKQTSDLEITVEFDIKEQPHFLRNLF